MKRILLPFLLLTHFAAMAQYPLATNPCSLQAEEGFAPCRDTFSILKRHLPYDLGLMLPTWLHVVNKNYVAVMEGKVTYNLTDGTNGPHVFEEDLPFCHYTHDVNFDILPDKTKDNRFTCLQANLVYKKATGNDTVLHPYVHCEWECGLGMANRINPVAALNDAGLSGGFFSAGHQLGDVIWNWPACGDWAHVEGAFVWDRGHPPSEAEIHPLRFAAFKRALVDQIIIGDSSVKFATRIDIFASGDGGAQDNNRYNSPGFVRRVNMSNKDYEFTTTIDIARPSANSHLRYTLIKRPGDTFSYGETVTLNDDSATVRIYIPWMTKNANDLEIYARSIHVYWDEGSGAAATEPIDIYKVKLTGIRFKHLDEFLTKAEVRLFANVGSDYIFINDFFAKKGRILTKGLGKTYYHKWPLNNEFVVSVPRGKSFRVNMTGWEVDGVDALFGKLLDPYLPCDRKTKRIFREASFSLPMFLRGCLDDNYGEISKLHGYDHLGKTDHFTTSPQSGINEDPCPGGKYPLKDRVFLSYTIEKVN